MRSLLLRCLGLLLLASPAFGTPALTATFNSATDVPVTANGYTATGSTVNLTLNFAPPTGTQLMVVKNTSLGFINGTFSNLAQGQEVALSFGGGTYHFVANYFGGSGNDLVLHWAGTQVWGWGWNYAGQLGNDSTTDSSVPVAVLTTGVLSGKTVISAVAGAVGNLALCSDGTVVTWGDNSVGQLGNNTVSSVPVVHSLGRALEQDNTSYSAVPVAVSVVGTALEGKVVIAVAAGSNHNLVLCSDGTVAAWGSNVVGQLGNNSTTNSPVPVAVSVTGAALEGKTVVAIAAGGFHSLALCSDGTVVAWGFNEEGQLGNNSATDSPVPVSVRTIDTALAGKTVVAVAAGDLHSLAQCSDGSIVAWGHNYWGSLGNNSTDDSPVPVSVVTNGTPLAGKRIIAISLTGRHALALSSDGMLAAWGYNYFKQLGNNSNSEMSPVPVAVSVRGTALAGKPIIAIAAGSYHSLVLCSDGTMAAWGDNFRGQLGDNSTRNSAFPVMVNTGPLPVGSRVVAINSGVSNSICLVATRHQPASSSVLNKYTGLYERLVQVKNKSASSITGFDLLIGGLPSSVSVANGYPVIGESLVAPAPLLGYRVHHGVPVGAGATVTVVVEFLSKARPMPKLNPTFTTTIVPSDDPPGRGLYGIPVSKVSKLAGRGNLVQFRSVAGSRYRLWYSVPATMATTVPGVVTVKDSALGWLASPVAFTAYGTVSNWMDEGPPKTIFTPLNDATRQYRVELLPVSIR